MGGKQQKKNLFGGLVTRGVVHPNNRHNIGFACVNHFARTQGIKFDKKQGHARIGSGEVAGNKVVAARPQTYMNLSGQSVSRLVKKFDISLNDLLVIHDDLDLPLGKIRISQGGGSGGHKGIDSIISYLESQDFIRMRVGISRPPIIEGSVNDKETEIIAYVLSDFTPDEKKIITETIPKVSEAILCLLTEGLVAAMNRYN
ncbi:MAG: aminoacyl-tRNA hydrolase [Dehalococcoidia bacterium]|nr:aminoacyl-tRNA hydrolase [Dehalococcoidia bacterium]